MNSGSSIGGSEPEKGEWETREEYRARLQTWKNNKAEKRRKHDAKYGRKTIKYILTRGATVHKRGSSKFTIKMDSPVFGKLATIGRAAWYTKYINDSYFDKCKGFNKHSNEFIFRSDVAKFRQLVNQQDDLATELDTFLNYFARESEKPGFVDIYVRKLRLFNNKTGEDLVILDR